LRVGPADGEAGIDAEVNGERRKLVELEERLLIFFEHLARRYTESIRVE
jgi:hypothetical protein